MAAKKTGISRELIIHPGETIADILEARNMTQSELAVRTGVSSSFVWKVISGQKDISGKFAMALEYALNVPKSFWLNLQARYDKELLEAEEELTINDEERKVRSQLNDVVKRLKNEGRLEAKESIDASIISLRKLFNLSTLCSLNKVSTMSAFRMGKTDKINPYVLGAWIRICQMRENTDDICCSFSKEKIDELLDKLKDIMLHEDENSDTKGEIKEVLKEYGIDFDIIKHFRGAPVQGFLYRRSDDGIRICMTIRREFADIFWFSLFHELGHLVNGDLSKASFIEIDGINEEKERAADRFAAERLINSNEYTVFLNKYKENPSYSLIERFAQQQRVKPYIIIGRMQKEKIIKYNMYSEAKKTYKWAE